MKSDEVCETCGHALNPSGTQCDACQSSIGFPNVRLAVKEESALEKRYHSESESVKLRKIENTAMNFENSININANVVIARSVLDVMALLKSENSLIVTFHRQVASGARTAENNDFDPKRDMYESCANPMFYKEINYAALTFDNVGVSYYGEAHMKLNSKFIMNRTSFFEENAFILAKKLKLQLGDNFPAGYRSTWKDKGKLALCKLHASLDEGRDTVEDFQKILVVEDGGNSDFIEAHIYGSIHQSCIENITLTSEVSPALKALFSTLNLTKYGITTDKRTS
jgi:hypothetical protein